MKIIWSDFAIENLRDIFEYIAQDSAEQAQRMIDSLIDCPEILPRFPEMGKKVPEARTGCRELHRFSYRIIYRANNDQIEIVAVLHDKQNYRKVIKTK